jgi:protein O-mannosyl-transferase
MSAVRVLLLFIAGASAYLNSLNGPLVLDDQLTIVENPQIRQIWDRSVLTPERELPVAGRPVANLTFALNYAIDGTNARGYRAVNILLHILCGIAAFALVRRTLALPGLHARFGSRANDIGFAAALLWLLHPLNSEVVNYLTQRTESLMALCYLMTLYASLRALDSHGGRWAAAAIAFCAIGTACKESIVTAPVMVMLVDRAFVFGSWKEAWRSRRGLYLGLLATWVLLAALLWSGPRIRSAGFGTDVTVWTYLLNQTVMITRYLWLTIWPRPLVIYYGWPQPLTLAAVLPQALFLLALMAITAVGFKFRPKMAFAGAWFFVTLAPASSIVPIATEVGAERRMYLPLLALIVLAVASIWSLGSRLDRSRPITSRSLRGGAIGILAVLLGSATLARNREYASSLGLAELTLQRWPTAIAHHMVGEQLLLAGRSDEAVAHLRKAVDGAPRAHFTLGLQLYNEGKLDEAIAELQAFVQLQPLLLEVPTAHVVLARAYARQQRWDEAAAQATQAIAKAPGNPDARAVLAEVLFKQEKVKEATAAYIEYLRFRPRDVSALTNLAILLVSSGRTDEAIAAFRRAADVQPDDGQLRRNLATALFDANLLDQAVAEGRRAAALRPNDPVVYDLVGQALARQGHIEAALTEFERAARVDPNHVEAKRHAAQARALLRR